MDLACREDVTDRENDYASDEPKFMCLSLIVSPGVNPSDFVVFSSGRMSFQMTRDPSIQLPRPDQSIERSRSKTYPKRTQQTGSSSINQITANGDNEGTTKIIAPSPVKRDISFLLFSFKKVKNENSPEIQRSKTSAPWEENGLQRSRSRCNTSSGSESENSNREHRKKRNRLRQENDMVDSAPQWEAVLRRQKEKNQADPNYRRSRHRSRSYVSVANFDMKFKGSVFAVFVVICRRSPDVQAKEELWKHIQKELVDPSGLSEEQLKEIPYTKIETQGDPIRIRHSHSPRSYRQYRRSQCSDGERSVLSEVKYRRNGSKDSLLEEKSQLPTNIDIKTTTKMIKTVQVSRFKGISEHYSVYSTTVEDIDDRYGAV
ncbi:hypothetical protein ASZ78_016599 [Callipepla squamata]|uniref:Uncharacterized protein n=1 Tax=Callipepla squamata TaxID=9009 RepID=A0A226MJ59_CALSU|nr:hypothetical protein ASZ78_016599 [Callipepla squamata]